MSSAQIKTVAIIGATGNQGMSVVKSLLECYPVRAFTRSPEKLQSLASEQPNLSIAHVADLTDIAAITANLKGIWALFVNTYSDYTQPVGAEEKQGRAIVDAARDAGVEWLVYSSLPQGFPFRSFEEKANVAKYAREVAKVSGLKNIFPEVC